MRSNASASFNVSSTTISVSPSGAADWEKQFNTQINKIRYVIEQIIANFKTWRIMHTDYRRPLATFATTIAAVIGLHFYGAA